MYNHYENWRKSRLDTIKSYLGKDCFNGKTVLELGCFTGEIGNAISTLGGKVTACDARLEHVETVRKHFPHINAFVLDCDGSFELPQNYDIIINFGMLYHLNNVQDSILSLAGKCKLLLLETEVCDSSNPDCILKQPEKGLDQAFHGLGSRPSEKYIEKCLRLADYDYKLIKDPQLNSGQHVYDWEINHTQTYRHGLRRFWICYPK